jgi:hypothetical protein
MSAAPRPWIVRAVMIQASDLEDAPLAEDLGEPPAHGDERGEREQIGVDHPLQLGLRHVQLALDRGQRHADHGLVDEHHRQRPGHRRQDPPLAVGGGRTREGAHLSTLSRSGPSKHPLRALGPRRGGV